MAPPKVGALPARPLTPAQKKLEVAPAEVQFDLKGGEGATPTCSLTLTNASDEVVAYKIKTTTPKRYLVKPNQEILLAGASITVTVVLQAKEATALADAPLSTMDNKDKFLIATVLVDENFVNQVQAARSTPKEVQALFTSLWDKKDKEDFKNLRLGCKFILSKPGAPSPASKPTPSGSALSAVKPTSTPIGSEKRTLASPAAVAVPAPSSPDEDASVTQQKYKELLTLLVQVTDERDRFQSSFKDASKELMALKESGKKGSGDKGGATKTATMATFQLWHLLLVAIVAFAAGRLAAAVGI